MIFTDQTRADLLEAVQNSRNEDEIGIDDFRVLNASIRALPRDARLDVYIDLTDLDISPDNTDEQNVSIALDFFGLVR